MSGENVSKRLRDIGAVEGRLTRLPIRSIAFYADDHPLAHPRRYMPVERALVESIKCGWKDDCPLGVREEGRGNPVGLVYGSRRLNAGLVAESELISEGVLKPKGDKPAQLMVPVVVLVGSDLAMWDARLAENSRPLAVPDTLSVLSTTFRRMTALGRTHEEIALQHGHGFSAKTVDLICQMPNLSAEAIARFDAGDLAVEVLEVLLDEAPGKRDNLLRSLLDKGAVTPRKARKLVREKSGEVKVWRPTPAVVSAFRKGLNGETASVAAVVAYFDGDPSLLQNTAPGVLARLEELRATVKPGRKPVEAA